MKKNLRVLYFGYSLNQEKGPSDGEFIAFYKKDGEPRFFEKFPGRRKFSEVYENFSATSRYVHVDEWEVQLKIISGKEVKDFLKEKGLARLLK